MLNGFNDPNLRQMYLLSLPQELQPERQRSLLATKKEMKDISIGEIHQLALAALNKPCKTL